MFERVIVASDLSKDSSALINSFELLKDYGTRECLLLQFWGALDIVGMNSMYNPTVFVDFEKSLQSQKEILIKQGYVVETKVLLGFSTNEINKLALDEGYSAVVVGTDKRIFSAMANELIHNAQIPILIVKSKEQTKKDLLHPEATGGCKLGCNILFPSDFSKNAETAFNYVVELAAKGANKVTLLHIQDEYRISPYLDDRMEEFNKIDTERLEGMKKILMEKSEADVEIVLKYGTPAIEILNLIKKQKIELVVMGSQGRGFVKEFFLGSVSHNIVRESPCSVLLVPAKR